MKEEKSKKKRLHLYVICLITSLLLISINIFRWNLIDILTPFLEPFLEILILSLFIISIVSSFIHLAKSIKIDRVQAIIPLAICSITFVIIASIPFDKIMLDYDFYINNEEMQKIINMIKNKEIKINPSQQEELINLPKEYKHLSRGVEK